MTTEERQRIEREGLKALWDKAYKDYHQSQFDRYKWNLRMWIRGRL